MTGLVERAGACLVLIPKAGKLAESGDLDETIEAQLSPEDGRIFPRWQKDVWEAGSLIACSLHVRCTVLARQMQELETRAVGGRLAFKKRRMRLLGSNTGDWVPGGGTVCRCLAGTEATGTTGHAEPGEHRPTEAGWQRFDKAGGRSEPDWACALQGGNPAMRVGSAGQRWRFAGCMWCRNAKVTATGP